MLFAALALFFGAKASAQEWIYGIGYEINGDTAVYLRDIWPKPDNGYIVSGHIAVEPEHYSGQPMLVSLSPDGTELDRKIYFKPYFMGSWPSVVFNNKEGEAYALMAYQPDNDPNSPNYFLNSPNPPDYAILGLYKLDEQGKPRFDYAGCLECGTCRILCGNTLLAKWEFPQNAAGISYRYG